MRSSATKKRLWLIMILTAAAIVVAAPKERVGLEINWRLGGFSFFRDLEIKQGLDLQGGTQLVFEAEMGGMPASDRETAIASAKEVISRRVDLYGVGETVVQTAKSGDDWRIIVELPGVTEARQAKQMIGQTARLEFREPSFAEATEGRPSPDDEATDSAEAFAQEISSMAPTDLSGRDLKRAQVQFDQQTGEPLVGLTFTDEGRDKFSEITKRNVGRRVGIFLDGSPLTVPVVQTPITDGQAVISGGFTLDQAKRLVVNLNAGALPVDLRVVSETQIGATLGEESVRRSVRAGMVGLAAVMLFMVVVYRKLGLIADAALLIYGLVTIAVYKLVPVTLTLPGVAGFLLSVGMATDANILIFERTKEELRRGHKLRAAVELGFGRAWDSIKDANAATLLTAFVLYNPFDWSFLNTSGMVRGFALTLTIGILIGLFTGIVVSRTLIRMFYVKKQ